jgi:hypothetical protein
MLVKTIITHMYRVNIGVYIYVNLCTYTCAREGGGRGGGGDGWVYLLPEGFVIINGSLKR